MADKKKKHMIELPVVGEVAVDYCEGCGDVTIVKEHEGRQLCFPCFKLANIKEAFPELDETQAKALAHLNMMSVDMIAKGTVMDLLAEELGKLTQEVVKADMN